MGLENIGKHIVGDSKWEKLYDGCPTTTSSSGQEQEETPTDFEPQTDTSTSKSTPTTALQVDVMEEDDEEQDEQGLPRDEECLDEEEVLEHSTAIPSPPPDSNNNARSIVEQEEEEEEEIGRSMSTSPPPQPQGTEQNAGDPATSPAHTSTSEPASEEKTALVDNLFQILPYWYFLNRAFGMPTPGGGQGGLASNAEFLEDREPPEMDGDEDEEDEIGADVRVGGNLNNPPIGTPMASQRLNSILILESLRQQLQANGQSAAIPPEQALQQGLHLSELLSRMSSGGNDSWPVDGAHQPDNQNSQIPSTDQEIDDQPLDLTSTAKPIRDDRNDKGNRYVGDLNPFSADKIRSPFILDEQTSKVFRSNPRSSKGYTAQELQAALHDIQSGKLGTRRAAVIYGIPRSTLRNKVYKLGKDRGRLFANSNHNNNGQSVSHALQHHNNNNNDKVGSGPMLGKMSYYQGLNSSYLRPAQGSDSYEGGSPASLTNARAHGRFGSNTDDEMDEGTGGGQLGRNVRHNLHSVLNSNGGVEMGHKLGGSSPPKIPSSSLLNPSSLSQLISKHAHRAAHLHHPTASASSLDGPHDDSCSSGSELHQGMLLSSKDWKHALTSEQLLNHHHHPRHSLLQQRMGGDGATSNLRPPHQQHMSAGEDNSSSSLDLAGKKSRPKRGKYRNYDREALIKAVRAVQNGEMSVHRAGSFFGVPHSTLEYKVKERHLLRRPKRKEVTSPVSQTKSSSPENSSDCGSSTRNNIAHAAPSSSAGLLKGGKPAHGNNSGDHNSGPHHLFPLAADLRESLSRYLNAEQQERNERSGGGHLQHDTSSHHDAGSGTEDEEVMTVKQSLKRGDDRRGTSGALALEGLIGNRLSNLFHLNDILLRGSSASEERSENLLDLSKK